MISLKSFFLVGLLILIPLLTFSQVNIEQKDVFLQKYSNKTSFKEKIVHNYFVESKTLQNHLIVYLVSENGNYIEGERGSFLVFLQKSLQVNRENIKITFLNQNYSPIISASIPHFEDIMLDIVKKLPGAEMVSDGIETLAKVLKVGSLQNLENLDVPSSKINNSDFYGIGKNWETQYHNGEWLKAKYLKIDIPFQSSDKNISDFLSKFGFGLFIYFQSSVYPSSCGIYYDYKEQKPAECTHNLVVNYSSISKEELTNQLGISDLSRCNFAYKITINGGGGYYTNTKLGLCLDNKIPLICFVRGVSDASDTPRTQIGTYANFKNLHPFNNRGWVNVSSFTRSSNLYLILDSKWGTNIDTWIYCWLFIKEPIHKLGYSLLESHNDDFGDVYIQGYYLKN